MLTVASLRWNVVSKASVAERTASADCHVKRSVVAANVTGDVRPTATGSRVGVCGTRSGT
jgi:hypothetical protein